MGQKERVEITEGFLETMTQKRFALVNYRTLIDKGLKQYIGDARRLEKELLENLELCGGIDLFNQHVDSTNIKCNSERSQMRPISEWP